MGGRAALLAALGMLACGACGAHADDDSVSASLADMAGVVAVTEVPAGEPGAADRLTGICLEGVRLADSPADLAADMSAYGINAFAEMGDDPDWSAVVDCAEPHEIEVYDVVSLPDDLDTQITSYSTLLESTGNLAASIRDAVTHECALAFEPAAAVMEASPIDVDVLPMVEAGVGLRLSSNPLPPHDWADGERSFACMLEQQPAGAVRAADLMTGDLASEQRVCLDRSAFVECRRGHDAERIAILVVSRAVDAGGLLGSRAVDDVGRVDLGDEQWSRLDEVCDRYLREVSLRPAPALVGVADTYPELYPDSTGSYRVICSARSPFGTAPEDAVKTLGSVFDQ